MKPLLLIAGALLGLTWNLVGAPEPQVYDNVPFDQSKTTTPAGYYGFDPAAFISGYQEQSAKDQVSRQKDEFETAAQYQERLKKLDSEAPYASQTYAFATSPTSIVYEAERETFTFEFKPGQAPDDVRVRWSNGSAVHFISVLLRSDKKDMGTYQAENAFGAVFTVRKSLISTYGLWLPKGQDPIDCSATVTVAPAEARTMKPEIRALLVVNSVEPYADLKADHKNATFSDPTEDTTETGVIFGRLSGVRFYDWVTGRNLASCP